jgi:hypothetical protein
MDQFRNALVESHLSDLGFNGAKFTWSNCRHDEGFVQERLDRAVANPSWCTMNPRREVDVLAARSSDHKPLLIRVLGAGENQVRFHRSFKFEAKWLLDEECQQVIHQAWDEGFHGPTSMQTAMGKLDTVRKPLLHGVGVSLVMQRRKSRRKQSCWKELQRAENPSTWDAIKVLQGEIEFLLEQEDIRWKQRAKQSWYQYGDRNTPYFHAWANHRRKVNQMLKITDEEGRVWKKQKEIGAAFTRFFQNLFTSGDPTGIAECLEAVEPRVTEEMNTMLLQEFTVGEIEVALHQMHPLKSPGPDGFAACFYQSAWPTVKEEVCRAVLGFLNDGSFDAELNSTYIALIPKVQSPSKVTDYRPISLCNVLYKLISKVLANRLKKILPTIISPTQSAFIPGRLLRTIFGCI